MWRADWAEASPHLEDSVCGLAVDWLGATDSDRGEALCPFEKSGFLRGVSGSQSIVVKTPKMGRDGISPRRPEKNDTPISGIILHAGCIRATAGPIWTISRHSQERSHFLTNICNFSPERGRGCRTNQKTALGPSDGPYFILGSGRGVS